MLDLVAGEAVWRPAWFTRGSEPLPLRDPVLSVKPRPRDVRADWNIKSGGIHRSDGPLPFTGFTVVVCRTGDGWFELAVPTVDVRLVVTFFEGASRSNR
jgi:hypothetical protein